MRWVVWLSLAASGCAALSANSNQSGASSAQSGMSSGQSGASSAQSASTGRASASSADSSNASNASSNGSQASTGSSNASTGSSNGSNASSNQSSGSSAASGQSSQGSSGTVESSAQSSAASGPSSSIVLGSALLLGVAGGIISTVYSVNQRVDARYEADRLRQLQSSPVPQPMPYKVEPIPLQPGVPAQQTPPPQQQTPAPQQQTPAPQQQPMQPEPFPLPPPEFEPAPFPGAKWEGAPSLDAMVLARAWLMANELQLKQDLALGAGPAIDDLAGIAGIAPAHRAHFGRVLQRNRAALLVRHEVTPQEAALMMSRVGQLVMADPILRVDGQAMLARF